MQPRKIDDRERLEEKEIQVVSAQRNCSDETKIDVAGTATPNATVQVELFTYGMNQLVDTRYPIADGSGNWSCQFSDTSPSTMYYVKGTLGSQSSFRSVSDCPGIKGHGTPLSVDAPLVQIESVEQNNRQVRIRGTGPADLRCQEEGGEVTLLPQSVTVEMFKIAHIDHGAVMPAPVVSVRHSVRSCTNDGQGVFEWAWDVDDVDRGSYLIVARWSRFEAMEFHEQV